MPSENEPATIVILEHLAQACEVHLHDARLVQRLRALAAREEPIGHNEKSPTLAQAAALAGALSRYANSNNSSPVALKALAFQVENALAAGARGEAAWRVAGLYVIVDPQLTRGRDVVDVARAALRGGASAIQLRDKVHDKGDQLRVACRLMEVCQEHGASFIVNDHADLAVACGAHGLHVGQHDLPALEARRVLYPNQFLGTSNALLQEAEASAQQQVDYIAVGAMYSTDSKGNTRPAGINGLRQVRQRVSGIPIVAIGGIILDNVDPVLEAGADGVCVIGAVCLADDPERAARLLVERIQARRRARPRGLHGSP